MATYLDLGYLNAVFKSTVKPLPDRPSHVEVTYAIEEGPQARIRGRSVRLDRADHGSFGALPPRFRIAGREAISLTELGGRIIFFF